ncbi:orexin receptor type 2-like isoform X3 [Tenebrio molitor]|uniref:orexin receptor type 2-like isoform X3 n=1 Tax=Tenebrio molitor TaxID=7067 RepID=UPI0036248DF1
MNDSNTSIIIDEIYEKLLVKNFLVIGLYVPVFITALLANVLVVWVVIKEQYMRSVTNYFLVNLSIADLFVALVCMPNAAYAAYTSVYSFGEYACKISAYLQCVSVASSIFTITAMAVDRYLAITRPFGFFYRCFNKRTTTIIILLMWILSLALFMPVLLVTGTSKLEYIEVQNKSLYINVHFCGEHWEKSSMSPVQQALGITWFIFMFVLPGLIILFAYSMMSRTLCSGVPPFDNNDGVTCMQQRNRLMRSRKRVACILLLLAFIFAGCWLPYHVVNLLGDVGNDNYKELTMYLLLLGHANSALNPVIYCALSRRFRNSIKDLICVDIHFTRRRQNMQWADSSGSGAQLHYLHRIKSVPTVHNQLHFTLARLQSSPKTSMTCAV